MSDDNAMMALALAEAEAAASRGEVPIGAVLVSAEGAVLARDGNRVIERREATRVSFVDAQVDIKETLRKQKIKEQVQTYIAHLKQTSYVWTIYDEPRPDAQNVAVPPDAAPLHPYALPG